MRTLILLLAAIGTVAIFFVIAFVVCYVVYEKLGLKEYLTKFKDDGEH